METNQPGPREDKDRTPQPDLSTQIGKTLSSIQNKKMGEFLTAEVLHKLVKLAQKNAGREEITRTLKPYEDLVAPETMQKLIKDLITIVEGQEDTVNTETTTEFKNTSAPKNERTTSIELSNLQTGLVLYDERKSPLIIKKINTLSGTVDIADESGKYMTGCKVLSEANGKVSVLYGKTKLALSFEAPEYTSHEGLDLAHENGDIALIKGDTFVDGKNISWKVDKIWEHNNSIAVEVVNTKGENVRLHLRDWIKKNNQEILKTLGDQVTLTRTVEEAPEENQTEEQIKPLENYSVGELTLTMGSETFILKKGESYADDDKVVWALEDIISNPSNKTHSVVIRNEAGEVRELPIKDWEAYNASLVIVTDKDEEHLFNPLKEPTQLSEEKIPEQIKTEDLLENQIWTGENESMLSWPENAVADIEEEMSSKRSQTKKLFAGLDPHQQAYDMAQEAREDLIEKKEAVVENSKEDTLEEKKRKLEEYQKALARIQDMLK